MAESSSSSSSWSSALSGKSDEEKEEMLDRMLTRLALCDDSKLQDLLSKLLPISIACLSPPSTSLRNKVIEILSHVNKRVKHQQQIGLPLSDLWKLYVESSAAPMIRKFCIVYIEMAIERVPKEEKQIMAPVFLANISKLPPPHQDILLRLTAKVIGECHSTQISDEVAARYRMLRGSKDSKIFLEFCLLTILYQPSPPRKKMTKQLTGKRDDTALHSAARAGNIVAIREIINGTIEEELTELLSKQNSAGETMMDLLITLQGDWD